MSDAIQGPGANSGKSLLAQGQYKLTKSWHGIRLIILLPCAVVLISALIAYSTGIPGSEIFLFLAGLAGGAALAEVAAALERKDAQLEKIRLQEENKRLSRQIMSIREPELAAAVEAGINFVTLNSGTRSEAAALLGIGDQIQSAIDANDIGDICDALRARFGSAVSESFLLGRQLPLLITSEAVDSEARILVGRRLALRLSDDDLVAAVDRVLADRVSLDKSAKAAYAFYIGKLMKYLSGSTTTDEASELRDRLVLGIDATYALSQEELRDDVGFEQFLQRLIAADVGDKDPDVKLFWAATTGDAELLQEALRDGASTTTTHTQIMRRYRDYLR